MVWRQLLHLVPSERAVLNARSRAVRADRAAVAVIRARSHLVAGERTSAVGADRHARPHRAATRAAVVARIRLRLVSRERAVRKRRIGARFSRHRAASAFGVAVARLVLVEVAAGERDVAIHDHVDAAAALGGAVGVEVAIGECRARVHSSHAAAAVERNIRRDDAVSDRRAC